MLMPASSRSVSCSVLQLKCCNDYCFSKKSVTGLSVTTWQLCSLKQFRQTNPAAHLFLFMGPTTLLLRTAVVPAVTKTSSVLKEAGLYNNMPFVHEKLENAFYPLQQCCQLKMKQEKGSDCTEATTQSKSMS